MTMIMLMLKWKAENKVGADCLSLNNSLSLDAAASNSEEEEEQDHNDDEDDDKGQQSDDDHHYDQEID